MSDTFNFEKAMQRLNEITALLEQEDTSLDSSIKLFEEGLNLAHECEKELNSYETKVKELVSKYKNDTEN